MLQSNFGRFESHELKQYFSELTKKIQIPGVNHAVVIASPKGGCGKSTISINTALALSDEGHKVALFDADIFNPSIPILLNTSDVELKQTPENEFITIPAFGIDTISVGNGYDRRLPLFWQGDFIPKLLQNLLTTTQWDSIDYLIIDTPPNNSDVLHTLLSRFEIDGTVLVSSPSQNASKVLNRTISVINAIKSPLIGLIENNVEPNCPKCSKDNYESIKQTNLDVLGKINFSSNITYASKEGFPLFLRNPDSPEALTFRTIAKLIISKMPKKEK